MELPIVNLGWEERGDHYDGCRVARPLLFTSAGHQLGGALGPSHGARVKGQG